MKSIHPLLLLATITTLLLTACTPSVFPLITEKEAVFDKALLGVWGDGEDDKETWTFTKADNSDSDKDYSLSITNRGSVSEFECQLGKLDGKLYLQMRLKNLDRTTKDLDDFGRVSLVRGYLFFRVWQIGTELGLSFPNEHRLLELLDSDPQPPSHANLDNNDRVILTGQTRDLQRFIIRHADDEKLFEKPDPGKRPIRRLKAPAAKQP